MCRKPPLVDDLAFLPILLICLNLASLVQFQLTFPTEASYYIYELSLKNWQEDARLSCESLHKFVSHVPNAKHILSANDKIKLLFSIITITDMLKQQFVAYLWTRVGSVDITTNDPMDIDHYLCGP